MSSSATNGRPEADFRPLPVSSLQKSPRAHNRIYFDRAKMAAFAEQMREGVVFSPIRVWWDGITYWLADGLHRVMAAEQAGLSEIPCEIHLGTQSNAQWDCYAHLAVHALRGSLEERQSLFALVFQHLDASALSDDRIAQHLGVAESLVRQWRKRFLPQGTITSGPEVDISDPIVCEAIDYMRANLAAHLDVPDVAKQFGVSSSQLWRRFRAASRVTPKAVITTVRVERAQELLRCTDLAPRDIALRVGYKTAGELDRAFSRVYGLRLREYRRLHGARLPQAVRS